MRTGRLAETAFYPGPGHPPLPYLYPPLTLPFLRALGALPLSGLEWMGVNSWNAVAGAGIATMFSAGIWDLNRKGKSLPNVLKTPAAIV